MQARSSTKLLEQLRERSRKNLTAAEQLLQLSDEQLNSRPKPDAWNAIECLAHLNHYSDYYLPEIRRAITTAKHPTNKAFTSSRLGNYFAKGMKPGPETRKISTFKSADPRNFAEPVDREVIQTFIKEQHELLELLDQAEKVNLTKTKTGISISNWIKLRLGDTLRVVVYHNWRHVEQAQHAAGVAEEAACRSTL